MAVGAYFAGIGIALCTTFMSALGMTLQKITHRRIEAAKLRARARQQQAQEMRELHLGDRGGGGVGGAGSAEARGGRTRRARRGADGDEADSDNTKQLRTWKQPLWLSGIGLMLASSLLSLAVFALVGQAVASCFAAVTLIWNAIFGYLVLRERLSWIDVLVTLLLLVGAIITITFGAQRNPSQRQAFLGAQEINDLFSREKVYIFSAVVGAIVVGAMAWVYAVDRRRARERRVRYWQYAFTAWWRPFLAGIFSATTGICSKGFTSIISAAGKNGNGAANFGNVDFWLFLVCLPVSLVLQIGYLNSGLRYFDATLIVPIYQSLIVVLGVVFGFIYWNEGSQLGSNISGFIVGIVIIVIGLSLLLLKPRARPLEDVTVALAELFDMRTREQSLRRTASDAEAYAAYGYKRTHFRGVEPLYGGRGRVLEEPGGGQRGPVMQVLRLRVARDDLGNDVVTFVELRGHGTGDTHPHALNGENEPGDRSDRACETAAVAGHRQQGSPAGGAGVVNEGAQLRRQVTGEAPVEAQAETAPLAAAAEQSAVVEERAAPMKGDKDAAGESNTHSGATSPGKEQKQQQQEVEEQEPGQPTSEAAESKHEAPPQAASTVATPPQLAPGPAAAIDNTAAAAVAAVEETEGGGRRGARKRRFRPGIPLWITKLQRLAQPSGEARAGDATTSRAAATAAAAAPRPSSSTPHAVSAHAATSTSGPRTRPPPLLIDIILPLQTAPLTEPVRDARYRRVMRIVGAPVNGGSTTCGTTDGGSGSDERVSAVAAATTEPGPTSAATATASGIGTVETGTGPGATTAAGDAGEATTTQPAADSATATASAERAASATTRTPTTTSSTSTTAPALMQMAPPLPFAPGFDVIALLQAKDERRAQRDAVRATRQRLQQPPPQEHEQQTAATAEKQHVLEPTSPAPPFATMEPTFAGAGQVHVATAAAVTASSATTAMLPSPGQAADSAAVSTAPLSLPALPLPAAEPHDQALPAAAAAATSASAQSEQPLRRLPSFRRFGHAIAGWIGRAATESPAAARAHHPPVIIRGTASVREFGRIAASTAATDQYPRYSQYGPFRERSLRLRGYTLQVEPPPWPAALSEQAYHSHQPPHQHQQRQHQEQRPRGSILLPWPRQGVSPRPASTPPTTSATPSAARTAPLPSLSAAAYVGSLRRLKVAPPPAAAPVAAVRSPATIAALPTARPEQRTAEAVADMPPSGDTGTGVGGAGIEMVAMPRTARDERRGTAAETFTEQRPAAPATPAAETGEASGQTAEAERIEHLGSHHHLHHHQQPLMIEQPMHMPDQMRMGVAVLPSGFSVPVQVGGYLQLDPRLVVAAIRAPIVRFTREDQLETEGRTADDGSNDDGAGDGGGGGSPAFLAGGRGEHGNGRWSAGRATAAAPTARQRLALRIPPWHHLRHPQMNRRHGTEGVHAQQQQAVHENEQPEVQAVRPSQ